MMSNGDRGYIEATFVVGRYVMKIRSLAVARPEAKSPTTLRGRRLFACGSPTKAALETADCLERNDPGVRCNLAEAECEFLLAKRLCRDANRLNLFEKARVHNGAAAGIGDGVGADQLGQAVRNIAMNPPPQTSRLDPRTNNGSTVRGSHFKNRPGRWPQDQPLAESLRKVTTMNRHQCNE